MHKTIRVLALLVASCAPAAVTPSTPPAPTTSAPPAAPAPPETHGTILRRDDLLADLTTLERVYRELHPGLARYNTPEQLDALFAAARTELDHDMPLGNAFVALTRLTAGLRCGHSYPNPSNQAKAIADELFSPKRLPFLFRWLGDDMVVTTNLSNADMPPGVVIESINGMPTRELAKALVPLARADGHNDAKRRFYMSVVGESTHEAFDILTPLLFPALFERPMIECVVRRPDGTRSTVSAPLQTTADRAAAVAANGLDIPDGAPLWKAETIVRDGKSIVYLKMPTWVAYNTSWPWQRDLEATMASVVSSKAAALVVDLRGNEGGSDVGDIILAHMIDRPMKRGQISRRVRFETVAEELRPVLDTWDKTFVDLGKPGKPIGGGWRELPSEVGTDVIAPKGPRFRGKLVVLVDASNSSATFQFDLAVQRAHLGTLVGEPTGGSQRGINGGAFFFVRLPRTHLEVDLPLIGTFPATTAPDAGVTPDAVVELSPADVFAKRDAQLDRAFAIATK